LQRHLGVLEDRAGQNGEAIAVALPALRVLADPVERPRLERVDLLRGVAAGAAHAARPALGHEVGLASIVGRESPVENVLGRHRHEPEYKAFPSRVSIPTKSPWPGRGDRACASPGHAAVANRRVRRTYSR